MTMINKLSNQNHWYSKNQNDPPYHIVQKGESLESIAHNYGIEVNDLFKMKENSSLTRTVLPGQKVFFPENHKRGELDKEKDSTPIGFSFKGSLNNDSGLPKWLVGNDHLRYQNGKFIPDDNGYTAGLELDSSITLKELNKTQQFGVWGNWKMLTERGENPIYRMDQIEGGIHVNHLIPIDENGNLQLIYGLGVGVQMVGEFGLDKLQDWFHSFISGARHLPESPHLQSNATQQDILQHIYKHDC